MSLKLNYNRNITNFENKVFIKGKYGPTQIWKKCKKIRNDTQKTNEKAKRHKKKKKKSKKRKFY